MWKIVLYTKLITSSCYYAWESFGSPKEYKYKLFLLLFMIVSNKDFRILYVCHVFSSIVYDYLSSVYTPENFCCWIRLEKRRSGTAISVFLWRCFSQKCENRIPVLRNGPLHGFISFKVCCYFSLTNCFKKNKNTLLNFFKRFKIIVPIKNDSTIYYSNVSYNYFILNLNHED